MPQPNLYISLAPLPSVVFQTLRRAWHPEPTLDRVLFLAGFNGTNYTTTNLAGIVAFDLNTFLPAGFVPLNIPANEGSGTNSTPAMDVIRWGQDGLAALTVDGTIYLVRGPAVVPQLLQSSTPPVLASSTPGTLQHGSENTVLTLSGTTSFRGWPSHGTGLTTPRPW